MDEKVIYSCVDQEHNTWNCRGCGYIPDKVDSWLVAEVC